MCKTSKETVMAILPLVDTTKLTQEELEGIVWSEERFLDGRKREDLVEYDYNPKTGELKLVSTGEIVQLFPSRSSNHTDGKEVSSISVQPTTGPFDTKVEH